MSVKSINLLGGESVYCINEGQLESARHLAFEDADASPRFQAEIQRLEKDMSRNERAALSFVLIDRLLQAKED